MILLDANILLEMLISGRPHKEKTLEWMVSNNQEFCISMLTVQLILHFGLKDALSISDIKNFLADYPKIALLPVDYVSSLAVLKDKDHEDALQLVVAERIGCSSIVTLDTKFSKTYSDRIHFISPIA